MKKRSKNIKNIVRFTFTRMCKRGSTRERQREIKTDEEKKREKAPKNILMM